MSFCITKNLNFTKPSFSNVQKNEETERCKTNGEIFNNTQFSWLINGSKIEVINYKSGQKIGRWDFSISLEDDSVVINCITEIKRSKGKPSLLALGLKGASFSGMVCLFDFIGSKTIRAIQFDESISAIHLLDNGENVCSLPGCLKNFDGILVVGTIGGNVYLVDICMSLCEEGYETFKWRDERDPCTLNILTLNELQDIEMYKKDSIPEQNHLAVFINAVLDKQTHHFVLREPNGKDKIHVNSEEVMISALHYCPQSASILIGFNFGAFQIWDLIRMQLVYTSPIHDDHIPITHFSTQEPCDDPRAFCYIWVVYGPDIGSSGTPLAVMYAALYESKEVDEYYGTLFEDFQYCSTRFQMELDLNNSENKIPETKKAGQCLRIDSITLKNTKNNDISKLDNVEDFLSLCVFVWNILTPQNKQVTYIGVFDLNQWYKEQMPTELFCQGNTTYFMSMSVSNFLTSVTENRLLDIYFNRKYIQQFVGSQKLEEHFYPCSLSFDINCLLEDQLITVQYQGVQRTLLSQIESGGPLSLVRPTEICEEILNTGLNPLFVEITSSDLDNVSVQRELVLHVALENRLLNWLCNCAKEWSNGSFMAAGLSFDFILGWSIRRSAELKSNCDKFCVSLFDHSLPAIDTNMVNLLNCCIGQIKNLHLFYSYIIKEFWNEVTNQELLKQQHSFLQTIKTYYQVLQWMLNVHLLPEGSSNNSVDNNHVVPYPAEVLKTYYFHRRTALQILNRKHFDIEDSLLFIDNLIENEAGGKLLKKEWKNDDGNGMYPPSSLQALLRTYLVEKIDESSKHLITLYFFLDLANALNEEKYSGVTTLLIKFPAVFKVSISLIKITQAFWHLDHGDLKSAKENLLDPLIDRRDLKDWHHRIALRSFVLENEHNFALVYLQVRKPTITTEQDVMLSLSLFVANNMLDEAFYLEKHYKDYFKSDVFVKHLYKECENHNKLECVLYRNLSQEEEEQFFAFLDSLDPEKAADIKVLYYVQRSRFSETLSSYEKYGFDLRTKGLASQSGAKPRHKLLQCYRFLLPSVSLDCIEAVKKQRDVINWVEVKKPTPMSVYVNEVNDKAEYRSTFIQAAFNKVKDTFLDKYLNTSKVNKISSIDEPFLGTPLITPLRKRSLIKVVNPRVIEEDEEPTKKIARLSFGSLTTNERLTPKGLALLHTPIVKRRSIKSTFMADSFSICPTPTSILKNRHISAKKEMIKSPGVRFSIPRSLTPASESSVITVKSTESSVSDEIEKNDFEVGNNHSKNINIFSRVNSDDTISIDSTYKTNDNFSKDLENGKRTAECTTMEINSYSSPSIKQRRSYKRLTENVTPVRSSPRIRKKESLNLAEDKQVIDHVNKSELVDKTESEHHSIEIPVITPRKSINRQVLERSSLKKSTSKIKVFHSEEKSDILLSTNNSLCALTNNIETMDTYVKEQNRTLERHSVRSNLNVRKESEEFEDDSTRKEIDDKELLKLNQNQSNIENEETMSYNTKLRRSKSTSEERAILKDSCIQETSIQESKTFNNDNENYDFNFLTDEEMSESAIFSDFKDKEMPVLSDFMRQLVYGKKNSPDGKHETNIESTDEPSNKSLSSDVENEPKEPKFKDQNDASVILIEPSIQSDKNDEKRTEDSIRTSLNNEISEDPTNDYDDTNEANILEKNIAENTSNLTSFYESFSREEPQQELSSDNEQPLETCYIDTFEKNISKIVDSDQDSEGKLETKSESEEISENITEENKDSSNKSLSIFEKGFVEQKEKLNASTQTNSTVLNKHKNLINKIVDSDQDCESKIKSESKDISENISDGNNGSSDKSLSVFDKGFLEQKEKLDASIQTDSTVLKKNVRNKKGKGLVQKNITEDSDDNASDNGVINYKDGSNDKKGSVPVKDLLGSDKESNIKDGKITGEINEDVESKIQSTSETTSITSSVRLTRRRSSAPVDQDKNISVLKEPANEPSSKNKNPRTKLLRKPDEHFDLSITEPPQSPILPNRRKTRCFSEEPVATKNKQHSREFEFLLDTIESSRKSRYKKLESPEKEETNESQLKKYSTARRLTRRQAHILENNQPSVSGKLDLFIDSSSVKEEPTKDIRTKRTRSNSTISEKSISSEVKVKTRGSRKKSISEDSPANSDIESQERDVIKATRRLRSNSSDKNVDLNSEEKKLSISKSGRPRRRSSSVDEDVPETTVVRTLRKRTRSTSDQSDTDSVVSSVSTRTRRTARSTSADAEDVIKRKTSRKVGKNRGLTDIPEETTADNKVRKTNK